MKIITFNLKKTFLAMLLIPVLTICVALFLNTGDKILRVFSNEKLIPIYCVESQSKKVSITINCAWGDGDIPYILDVLKQRDVKATFFIVGHWAEKFPDTVKSIQNEGHEIANHSYSHLIMSKLEQDKIIEEIRLCQNTLEKITGVEPVLFRAPYGDYNNNVLKAADELGCYSIQWDVDSLDWKKNISKENLIDRVVKKTSAGSIILFHNDTQHTADALPIIIDKLQTQGYELVPVSKMLLKEGYEINFEGRQIKKK